jgi:uncharacterized membrane protein SpoIIM required for sporulation
MNQALIWTAWKKLMAAYGISLGCSLAAGSLLVYGLGISAETVFEASTKRLSYAMPVFDAGTSAGIDSGMLIFFWNGMGALVTISFLYSARLLDPGELDRPPRGLRKLFCGASNMRLLCFLPGCSQIGFESTRRLYVWLMIPILSLILLGIESGLSLATAKEVFGSYRVGIVSMLPHGILEIPTFSLAGAVTYSAHLMVRQTVYTEAPTAVFQRLHQYRTQLPVSKIALLVALALLAAGLIEAHVTHLLIEATPPDVSRWDG